MKETNSSTKKQAIGSVPNSIKGGVFGNWSKSSYLDITDFVLEVCELSFVEKKNTSFSILITYARAKKKSCSLILFL